MNFSPDKPIQHLKDDALGREPFVRSIESAIRGWKDKESLVLAITGPWGSGKSSVKNMLKDSLGLANPNVQVVEFNPWQWAGQDQLGQAFFREIEIALGKSPSGDSKKNAAKWRLYSARLHVGSFVSDTASQMITRVLSVVAGSGLAWTLMTDHIGWAAVILFFTVVVVAWGKLIHVLGEFASKWAELKEARAAVYEMSMEELKGELRQLMEGLSKPILVIIDDIDRLTASQIGYLFQLVKANADFPNLVYVLLMESRIVEKSLDSISAGNGKDYLGKIVQVTLPLPLPARLKLIGILEREARALVQEPVPLTGFDELEWASAFIVISPIFRTLRDVHRFINVLAFDISVLRGKRTLSVNVVDLVCLVALKVLHEKVYHQLPRVKRFLTKDEFQVTDEQVKSARESILSASSEVDRNLLRPLLVYLFPSFPWDDDRFSLRGFNEDDALRNLRVHHPKNFDRYFVYSIESDDIAPEDFEQLLRVLPSRNGARSYFQDCFQRGVLVSVFERLAAYIDKLELQHIEPLLTALFDISDECLPEWPHRERSVLDRFYLVLSSKLLMRIEDFDQRLHTFSSSIEHTTGLYLPVGKVSVEDQGSNRRALGLSDEQLQPLRTVCVRRIQEWAVDGRLIRHPALGFLLFRWEEWAKSSQWKEWVVAQTETKEGLLAICSSQQGMTVSSEGVSFHVQLDLLEKLVDIDLLEKKLSLLDKAELAVRETETVNLFFCALQSRRAQNN
ncbi:MAG: P-loop NTPase fold protein [Nitrospiraceae bacterium]